MASPERKVDAVHRTRGGLRALKSLASVAGGPACCKESSRALADIRCGVSVTSRGSRDWQNCVRWLLRKSKRCNTGNMALGTSDLVDDIEDASTSDSLPHSSQSRPAPQPAEPHVQEATAGDRASVPGVQTVYVRTFGCSHNQSDSEYMMGVLQAYGYRCARLQPCTATSPAVVHDSSQPCKALQNGTQWRRCKSLKILACQIVSWSQRRH